MTILPVLFRFYLKMKKATVNHLAKHLSPASRVLMRADFNVPIKDKQVLDLNRIKSKLSTIQAPSLPLKSSSSTTPSHWFSWLIREDPTENVTNAIPFVRSLSLLKGCSEDQSNFSMIVWENTSMSRSANRRVISSSVRMFVSTPRKLVQSKTGTEIRSRAIQKLFKNLENNYPDWGMSM